jgi:transcriptional regulator of acetoin/glycerol metabolism
MSAVPSGALIHRCARVAVCLVAEGATPPPGIEAVSSSWQRSAKKYGLDPIDSKAPRILTPAELKNFCEPLDRLIFSAQEEIDQLYEVVRESWIYRLVLW